MPQVIGYAGENGAGKSSFCETVSALAKKDNFTVGKIGFSEPLRETFQRLNDFYKNGCRHRRTVVSDILEKSWGIPATVRNYEIFRHRVAAHFEKPNLDAIEIDRPTLQRLVDYMEHDEAFGRGSVSQAVFGRASRLSDHLINADGIRLPTDVVALRKLKKPSGLLVYITAPEHVRFSRMRDRDRDGEGEKTDEQFRLEEQAPTEVHIPTIGKSADPGCTIINDSNDPKDMQKKAEIFYEDILRPRLLTLR